MKLSGVRLSVCPSVPSFGRRTQLRRVCCCGPGGQEISWIAARPALRSKCKQCHVVTLLNADVYCTLLYCVNQASISGQLLQRLQSVFNAAARLVFSAKKSEHITPLLRELHWL